MPIRKKPALESVSSRADEYFIEAFGKDLCYKWANSDRGLEDFHQYFNSLNPYKQLDLMVRFLDHIGRPVASGDDAQKKLKVWLDGNAGVYNETTRTHRPKGVFKVHDYHVGVLCETELALTDMHSVAIPTMQPDAKGSYIFMMEKEGFVNWMGEMIATGSMSNSAVAVENWLTDTVKNVFNRVTGKPTSAVPTDAEKKRLVAKYVGDAATTISMVLKYEHECMEAIGHGFHTLSEPITLEYGKGAISKITVQMDGDLSQDPRFLPHP